MMELLKLLAPGGNFKAKLEAFAAALTLESKHLEPEQMQEAVITLVRAMQQVGAFVVEVKGSPAILEGRQLISIGVIYRPLEPLEQNDLGVEQGSGNALGNAD